MKCKLLDICVFRKGKVDVSKLTLKTYISTENMFACWQTGKWYYFYYNAEI